jgi:signal transduction histidine kinase/DNA-binding response OmpR family regulator
LVNSFHVLVTPVRLLCVTIILNSNMSLILLNLVCVGLAIALSVVWFRANTAIRRLRAQLDAATEAQRNKDSLLVQRSELDKIKDEFISTVSHELRTPLTSIRGALGLLSAGLMGNVDAKAQNLLRIAVTNTDRLIRLINDILDIERMESGRATLQVRRINLLELVQQGVDTMTAMADAAGVAIVLEVTAPTEAVALDGDSDRILQVVTNLLSNAIKFSPAKTTVHVHIEADPDWLTLRVSDEGRGIPVDKLETIFDRFQQVEASDARQKGGTGLGLAICKTIVQQHNGSIWAESNVQQKRGPGASLVVAFPRVARQHTSSVPANEKGANRPAPSRGTIIVCDDDDSIRTIVSEHLERHGYRILEADNGEKAIALASSNSIQAILLDLYMPGLSGWETLQRLKDSKDTASIPVVVLSVLSPSAGKSKDSAKQLIPQGWVQKPFEEERLLAEISRVLHMGNGSSHVLLVEDDADLAAVIIAGFEEAQVRVDHANTRQSAMDQCLLDRPALIILDLTLPDGDGFSLVEWLRQQPDLLSLPLVVYSGRDLADAEMTKLRLGPTDFLTKAKVPPSEVEELVLNIVQHLRPTAARPRAAKTPL